MSKTNFSFCSHDDANLIIRGGGVTNDGEKWNFLKWPISAFLMVFSVEPIHHPITLYIGNIQIDYRKWWREIVFFFSLLKSSPVSWIESLLDCFSFFFIVSTFKWIKCKMEFQLHSRRADKLVKNIVRSLKTSFTLKLADHFRFEHRLLE